MISDAVVLSDGIKVGSEARVESGVANGREVLAEMEHLVEQMTEISLHILIKSMCTMAYASTYVHVSL